MSDARPGQLPPDIEAELRPDIKFSAIRQVHNLAYHSAPCVNPEIQAVKSFLEENIHRFSALALVPEVMVRTGVGVGSLLLSTAIDVAGSLRVPEHLLEQVKQEYESRAQKLKPLHIGEDRMTPPQSGQAFWDMWLPFRVPKENWIINFPNEVDRAASSNLTIFGNGLKSLLSALLLNAHTVFESCAIDAWRVAVNQRPATLALNAIDSRNKTRPKNPDDSQQIHAAKKDEDRTIPVQWLVDENFDLRTCMGDMLVRRSRASFDCVDTIQWAYERTFLLSTQRPPIELEELFKRHYLKLRALESMRNLIAHRGGIVDKKFRIQVKNMSPELEAFPQNKPLPLDGELVRDHAQSAIDFSVGLLQFVDGWLTNHQDPIKDDDE